MADRSKIEFVILDLLLAGCISGVSKTIYAPLDRVKLLLQLQDASPKIMEGQKYTGIYNCSYRVRREQGFFSLWRGNLPCLLKNISNPLLMFAFKDFFVNIITPYDPQKEHLKFF